MAVTQKDYEGVRTPYAQARDKLQTGDILLFHSTGVMSQIIEHFTESPWSHAACILRLDSIGRVFIIESVEKIGVRMMPMSSRINGLPDKPDPYPGRMLVARHSDFPKDDLIRISAMTRVALERLGYPYSPMELVKIAERIGAGLLHRLVPGQLQEDTRYICSEYVAACYQAIGITLTPDKKGFMAPADIANDPKVSAVLSLAPDDLVTKRF